ncbi:MAG: hypothetical protein BWY95_02786 [Bacteroidetes bacterium ADurb.BinA104]|nr:MAG: hypothetical protein BWY95_02786 [Bacteroidetes bacterium ADurb.BinA104]
MLCSAAFSDVALILYNPDFNPERVIRPASADDVSTVPSNTVSTVSGFSSNLKSYFGKRSLRFRLSTHSLSSSICLLVPIAIKSSNGNSNPKGAVSTRETVKWTLPSIRLSPEYNLTFISLLPSLSMTSLTGSIEIRFSASKLMNNERSRVSPFRSVAVILKLTLQ